MGQIIHSSPVSYKNVDLSWMVGRAFTEVSFHEPSLWCFLFGRDANIGVECLWRIIERGRIILTNEDHGHQFGLPAPLDAVVRSNQLLVGRIITAVHLREATADILIEFTGDLRLEITNLGRLRELANARPIRHVLCRPWWRTDWQMEIMIRST